MLSIFVPFFTASSCLVAASISPVPRRPRRFPPAKSAVGFAALLLLAVFPSAQAATDSWVGNTSANWNDLNWTGGNNPPATTGDALIFGAAGSSGTTLNNNFSTLSVTSVTFSAGSDAYTMNGNAITLSAAGAGIANNGTNLQDFKTDIVLGNTNTFTAGLGGGNLTFDGVISNTVAHTLTLNGGGIVTLNGNNSYGSGLNTSLGAATTLVLGNDNALGASTLQLTTTSGGGGTVIASATRTIANKIILNNTGVTGIIGGSNAITFTGDVSTSTAAASGSLTVNNSAPTTFTGNWVLTSGAQASYTSTLNGTGAVTISGSISNGTGIGNLTHSGSGVLTLSGANTYSGTTTFAGGQVNLNNAGNGTSSSLGTSALVFSSASTIDNTSGAPITLSTNNTVTLSNNTVTFGGSNNLNLGTGAVTWASNNQSFVLNGTNSVLTFGGTVTNNNSSATNQGMVVNGAGNTLVLGGFTSTNHTTGKIWFISGSGNVLVAGQISNGTDSSVGLNVNSTGMVTLAGDNVHSGTNTLVAGTVNVNSSTAFGTGIIAMNGGKLDNTSGSAITLTNNNAITWGGNNTFIGTNDLNLGTGAVTISGANRTWAVNGGTLTVGGSIGSAGFGFTKNGNGTMVLTGASSYTGLTGLAGGTLTLDFSNVSANTSVASSASTLTLGATTTAGSQILNLQGKDSTADLQTFASTTFFGSGAQGGGATHVFLSTSGVGGTMTLALGNFTNSTRQIGAAIDFNIPANTFVTTTSPMGTDGLLQNNPTVNGNDFATLNGNNIVGLSTTGGYASISNGASTLTGSKANDIAAGSVSTNTLTASSLRFNDGAGDATLTINAGKTLTLRSTNGASAAILITSAVGAHTVKITGGTIAGINSRDLAIIQNNIQGILEIDSIISDNTVTPATNNGLTKSGLGTVLLTASNAYSNSTYINEGTLIADGASNALGTNAGTASTPNIISIAGGATLQIGNNDAGGNLSTGTGAKPTVINNNGSLVFNRADNALELSIAISGAGTVSQSGTGTVALTGANAYTGTTTVNSGNLQVGAAGVGQTGTGTTTLNGSLAILSGTGTVQGPTVITQGAINPGDKLDLALHPTSQGGDSMGTLNLAGGATFNPSTSSIVGNLTLGTAGVGDKIHVTGGLILNANSTFAVTFDPGYSVNTGDSWTLMDWSGALALNGFSTGANLRTGGESALVEGNLDLPDLTSITGYAGQVWQISDLTNNGALSVSIVDAPEPGRTMLLVLGLAGMVMRRRRKR
jgi:autotransporter-associated beta strand protein